MKAIDRGDARALALRDRARYIDIAARHRRGRARARAQALLDLLTPIAKGWCTERGFEIASLGSRCTAAWEQYVL